MATPLTENQRLWLHALYASEYAWTMHHVDYLRTAASGTESASKKKALLKEADEREGYARLVAALRDAEPSPASVPPAPPAEQPQQPQQEKKDEGE